MLNAFKEMVLDHVVALTIIKEIRMKVVDQNAFSALTVQLTKHVSEINARTHVLVFVDKTHNAYPLTMFQLAFVWMGIMVILLFNADLL